MDDSAKYDLPDDEVQRLMLGLITAASIDAGTVLTYWAETFPEHPDIPVEDFPSYIRLHGQVIGRMAQILNAFRDTPETKPYIEGILHALRTGDVF